jgi:hypothetical protein
MLNLADGAHDNECSAQASRLADLVHRALRVGDLLLVDYSDARAIVTLRNRLADWAATPAHAKLRGTTCRMPMLSMAYLFKAFQQRSGRRRPYVRPPCGSLPMILKSKYLYNLRPDRDSNAGPTA